MSASSSSVKQATLHAALELISEQGFHDAPMARLAELAGVGVGSIYRHFEDKTDLIEELYRTVDEKLQQAILSAVDPALSPRQQFIQLLTKLIDYLHNNPQEFKFLEQYYHSPFGIDKRRERLLLKPANEQRTPFQVLFSATDCHGLKPLPRPLLHALTFGPVLYLMRDVVAGLVKLDETIVAQVAESCWEAISAEMT